MTDVSNFPGPEGGKVAVPQGKDFEGLFKSMGIEPDGTVPPLVPELRETLVEREVMGLMLNHPLVHDMYWPGHNGHYNRMLELKRRDIARWEQEEKWYAILFIHIERPYRLQYLLHYAERIPDADWWELVGAVWTDSENIFQHIDEWREVFASDRPGREHIMDAESEDDTDVDEHALFAQLPEVVKVYRGTSAPDKLGSGLSWTLDRDRAIWFAKRYRFKGPSSLIAGKVRKKNVIAFFDRRSEREIICLPEHVFDTMTRRVEG